MSPLEGGFHNWVTGERFWDREREIALFIEKLNTGAQLRIIAQRRIGKTSLIREVARRLNETYACLYVDLEKCNTPTDAVVELSKIAYPHLDALGKAKEVFPNIVEAVTKSVSSIKLEVLEIKLRDDLTAGNWMAKGDKVFDALARLDKPVVVCFDEITILVNHLLKGFDYQITPDRIQATNEFMNWLRSNSIKHKGKIRLVMTGSIGFEPILNQAGLSATLNTIEPFEIEPWDTLTANACIMALAEFYQVSFEPGATERMVEKLGCCIPHHVQIYFQYLYDKCKLRGNMKCTIADVEHIYQTSLLGSKGLAELSHYEERLKMVLGERLFPVAVDLLTETAVTGHLAHESAAILLQDSFPNEDPKKTLPPIFDILKHDGYLRQEPFGYVFISPLLQDWWKARHEAFFVPAGKRRIKHA